MTSMITLENVFFDYEDFYGKEKNQGTIKNVSLSIEKGSFVALLGHNGSGKSTIAKLMNGILVPNSGKVTVDGFDTSDENHIWEIRQRVGMVFQNPDNQIVATTVEEDVAFGPENLGVPPEEICKIVDEALESVKMSEYKEHSPSQLSGGQKQRVAIAGILAIKPSCIIFDEATAMLDPRGRDEVMAQIMKLREEGLTVILITHYMNEAVYADRVVVINEGECALDGTPKEVFSQVEKLRNLGLDVPQVTYLSHLLKKDGYDVREDVLFEEEAVEELAQILK